jgi:predicted XRE-type DNA-binding protein
MLLGCYLDATWMLLDNVPLKGHSRKMKRKTKKYATARNAMELAEILDLSPADGALFEYKSKLSQMAAKAIEDSGLTVNEIVKRSGVARSKVSAIKNGAIAGLSIDLFLKVISAAGGRVTFKLASGY